MVNFESIFRMFFTVLLEDVTILYKATVLYFYIGILNKSILFCAYSCKYLGTSLFNSFNAENLPYEEVLNLRNTQSPNLAADMFLNPWYTGGELAS